jgi:hypothetical protein
MAHENPNEIAWIRVLGRDGHIVAATGRVDEAPKYSQDELRIAMGNAASVNGRRPGGQFLP